MTHDRLAEFERRLSALEDEREIGRILATYGPLVDAGEAELAAGLWSADGVYDVGDWLMNNRAEIATMVRSDAHQGLIAQGCCHFFGPPVIEVDGDDAVSVCESIILVRRESGGYAVLRAGVHEVRLRRTAGGRAGARWQITSRTARQLDGQGAARDLISRTLGVSRPNAAAGD